jgi:hypothetical protein
MNNMRILIACEESQEVCKAFRKLGHDAFSCDTQPCSGGHPEWHIKGDVLDVLGCGGFKTEDGSTYWYPRWDMMIAHPPCTRLCNSGVRWLHERNLWEEMRNAATFFHFLMTFDIPKIAVENPIMHKYAKEIIGKKQDQIIQPYQFGHTESKATCLWLKGLPKLKETNNVKEEMMKLPLKERQRIFWLGGGHSKEKSKTFPGIAKAMADQWGALKNVGK